MDAFYLRQHDELVRSSRFPGATGLALIFRTTSQRYYLFIMQPQHRTAIQEAISGLLASAWGSHFLLL